MQRSVVGKLFPAVPCGVAGALAALIAMVALVAPAVGAQPLHAGPDTCVAGYVFRGAFPGDAVCVTPDERRLVELDNRAARSRISPGAYGPDQCLAGFVWRLARPSDLVCVVPAHRAQIRLDNQLAAGRRAANGSAGPNAVPPPRVAVGRQYSMALQVTRSYSNNSTYGYAEVPVVGMFIHRGLNCQYGRELPSLARGTGASLVLPAGWGQVMGTGHPDGGKDPCTTWVTQAAIDFDLTPYTSAPGVRVLRRADLSYREQEAPSCMTMVYTQGGFAVDPLPCYASGRGDREAKPNGCVLLAVPSQAWADRSPSGPLATLPDRFAKLGPGTWDVTALVTSRVAPGLSDPDRPIPQSGHGFVLVGTPMSARSLQAHDNTRCASVLSDFKLTLYYTIRPSNPSPGTVVK